MTYTTPLIIDHNRPFIEVEFDLPMGGKRKALAWIDTGDLNFGITEPLARELGLNLEGSIVKMEDGTEIVVSHDPLAISIAGKTVDLSGIQKNVALQKFGRVEHPDAEVFIGMKVLKKLGKVVFDYPNRLFIHGPNSVSQQGVMLPCSFHPETGIIRLEMTVEGQQYGMLLDTGASYTMVSGDLVKAWREQFDYPTTIGALGYGNMNMPRHVAQLLSGYTECQFLMMRVPEIQLETISLKQVGIVWRPPGMFEKGLSNANYIACQIYGALAGNVWTSCRIEIDFFEETVWVEQLEPVDQHDLDLVGISFYIAKGGECFVDAVTDDIRDEIYPGDKIINIEEQKVKGLSIGAITGLLKGDVDDLRKITVERNNEIITTAVKVKRHL